MVDENQVTYSGEFTVNEQTGKITGTDNLELFLKEKGYKIITFTGFDENNPLKSNGDINFWVDSRAYNIVEMVPG